MRTPKDAPYFVTAAEQYAWGGINRYSAWDQDLVRDRRAKDMRGKGVGLVTHFVKLLLARGVPIRLDSAADGLTVEDGRVTGVRMADGTTLSARKGVVLATGGYEWNAELMRDFDPIPRLQPLSPPSSTGDGLIMGAEIGAAIRRIQNNLNLMLGFYLVPDEPSAEPIQCMAGISEMCSPHTIVVNKAGQRFADESYFQSVVPALRRFDTLKHDYANLPCFLIFDRQFLSSYCAGASADRDRRCRPRWRAPTRSRNSPASSASMPAVSTRPSSASTASQRQGQTRISSAASCAGGWPTARRKAGAIQASARSTGRRSTASNCARASAPHRRGCWPMPTGRSCTSAGIRFRASTRQASWRRATSSAPAIRPG